MKVLSFISLLLCLLLFSCKAKSFDPYHHFPQDFIVEYDYYGGMSEASIKVKLSVDSSYYEESYKGYKKKQVSFRCSRSNLKDFHKTLVKYKFYEMRSDYIEMPYNRGGHSFEAGDPEAPYVVYDYGNHFVEVKSRSSFNIILGYFFSFLEKKMERI